MKEYTGAQIPSNANVPTSRFELAIEHKIIGKVRFKARYVVEGHRDRLRSILMYDSQTQQPIDALLFLALSAISNFNI